MPHHRGPIHAAVIAFAVMAASACGGSADPGPPGGTPGVRQEKMPATTSNAAPQPVDREVFAFTGFVSPSGNVSCVIDVDYVRCDIIDRDWSPPRRPADCEFDYGQGISLSPGEQAQFVCAGDTAFGADEVLPYGESITAGPIACESAESGITCRDRESGHGFSISRQAYRLF